MRLLAAARFLGRVLLPGDVCDVYYLLFILFIGTVSK